MRTKIGNYKLKYPDRKRKDWRRAAITEFGLLMNAWISAFFVPVYWLGDSEYGLYAAIGSALVLSLVFCFGLYRLRNSPLQESFWVSNTPSIIAVFSIGFIGFYLLLNFLLKGFHPLYLCPLAMIYALPFVYESRLPRAVAEHRPFGSNVTDDNDLDLGEKDEPYKDSTGQGE